MPMTPLHPPVTFGSFFTDDNPPLPEQSLSPVALSPGYLRQKPQKKLGCVLGLHLKIREAYSSAWFKPASKAAGSA